MQVRKTAFRPTRGNDWTLERVTQLSKREIEQLRLNARTLGETAVVALCDEALAKRPARTTRRKPDQASQ